MKPSKLGSPSNQQQEEADITDIAEIFQKLNNRSSAIIPKPYSEYDAQSIFPPPSQISLNNDLESDRSKSNCLVNFRKRPGVSQNKEEKQLGFGLSKPQLGSKKLKRIEVQKVNPNQKLLISEKSLNQNLSLNHLLREEQVSNKESILNNNNNKDLVPLHPPTSNFKITDFFLNKKVQSSKIKEAQMTKKQVIKTKDQSIFLKLKTLQQQQSKQVFSFTNIQEPKINPIINSLVEKNDKKRKIIQNLKQELRMFKQKKKQMSLKLCELKNQEKSKLKQKLLETNQIKMQYHKFQTQICQVLLQKNVQKSLKPDIQMKLKNLQQNKKKGSQKRGNNRKQTHTDEQSVGNTENRQSQKPHQLPQKKHYINHWISKLQKLKQKIEQDTKFYTKLGNINKTVQKVSQQIQQRFRENQILKEYVLFSLIYPLAQTKAKVDQLTEINAFNLESLRHETLTILKLPKFSTQINKNLICKQLSNLYKLSKKLHNSTNYYFLQTTVAQTTKNIQFVIYGREKIDEYETLLSALHKYEGFSQLMVKYIARICLIVFEEIKVKVDIPAFLLPINIYFDPKYDIKFSNILMNNLFLKEEFKPYLNSQKLYYFVPPEGLSQRDFSNAGIWSLGILLYFIIYEKYPFEYEMDNLFQKETFWIYNQLNFPSKPVVSQKLKDFITTCLTYKEKDPSSLVKHQFFNK